MHYACRYCQKLFRHHSNLYRHQSNNCKKRFDNRISSPLSPPSPPSADSPSADSPSADSPPSPSVVSPLPSSPPKRKIPFAIRRLVWNAHVGEEIGKTKCQCCGSADITQMQFHCGHVLATAHGGETVVSNLRPICMSCNLSMGTMNMNDFMRRYGLSAGSTGNNVAG